MFLIGSLKDKITEKSMLCILRSNKKKTNKRNVAADLHHYITETPLISFIEIRFMNKHQVWNRWCKNRYLLVRAYDYTIHYLQPISEHH